MNLRFLIIVAISLIILGCGSGSTPSPYLVGDYFELQDGCVTDFSTEEGSCVSIVNGQPDPICRKNEAKLEGNNCIEHFYIKKRRGRPVFVHVNAKYPCYSDWVYERYSNKDSEWYRHGNYNVVAFRLASNVTDNVVQLLEIVSRENVQEGGYCYYRLETEIVELSSGEYGLKIWDPDRKLILSTTFTK